MRKTAFSKILLFFLLTGVVFAAFLLSSAATEEPVQYPIYISTIGQDYKDSDGTTYSRWASNAVGFFSSDYLADGYTADDTVIAYKDNTARTSMNMYMTHLTYEVTSSGVTRPAFDEAKLVESGLYYTYDSSTKTVTISGQIKKDKNGVDVLWYLPAPGLGSVSSKIATPYSARGDVLNVIISADTGITRVPEHCLNYFTNIDIIEMPSTVKTFENECLARIYGLQALRITDSGVSKKGIVDLRYITYFNTNTFNGSTMTTGIPKYYFLFSSAVCSGRGTAFLNGAVDAYMFVPEGTAEDCTFFSTLVTKTNLTTNVFMVTLPDSLVTELGYQVRTDKYTGLRGKFAVEKPTCTVIFSGTSSEEENAAKAASFFAEDGTLGIFKLKEYGTIAIPDTGETAIIDDSTNYQLTKNAETGVYEALGNTKAKKVAVWTTGDGAMTENFYVSIVKYNCTSATNLRSKVFMTGYEIWEGPDGNETVVYTADDASTHCDSVSILDATVGMYKAGLINKSVEGTIVDGTESDIGKGVFWGVLDNCREDLSATKNAENISAYETDAKKTYAYSFAEDGSVIDNSGAGAKVSVFKMSNGKYVGIVSSNGSVTTFTGASFNYQTSSGSWTAGNLLSPNYLGVTIDTLVIDSDITKTGSAGALGMYRDCARVIIYPDDIKLVGQIFNGSRYIETLVPFSKCASSTDWDSLVGVLDASRADLSSADLSWSFNQLQKISTVLLPSGSKSRSGTMTTGFFKDSIGKITKVYCPDYYDENGLTPEEGTADFRGTNYIFDYAKEETLGTNAVFRNSLGIIKAISSDGTVSYRCKTSSGTSYEHSKWQLTDPSAS